MNLGITLGVNKLGAGGGPEAISGLVSWFKADSGPVTNGIASVNNDLVDTWADQYGGKNLTGSAGARPVFKTAIFASGLPGVYFNTDDFMAANAIAATASGADMPFTVAIIAKYDSGHTAGSECSWSLGHSSNAYARHRFLANTTFRTERRADDASAAVVAVHQTVDNNAAAIIVSFNGTSEGMYLNSTTADTDASDVATATFDIFTLGASRVGGAPSLYFWGYIGEFIFYNKALSTQEVLLLMPYLKSRAGI